MSDTTRPSIERLEEAVKFAAATFKGFRAACSECDDEGRELDWKDVDRRCCEAVERLAKALLQPPSQGTDQRHGADSPTGLVGLADQTSEPPPNKVEKQFSPCEPAPGVQSAPATPIPEGWKLVPVEPTGAMLEVARGHGSYHRQAEYVYRAMLAAAPEPPAHRQQGSMADEQGDPRIGEEGEGRQGVEFAIWAELGDEVDFVAQVNGPREMALADARHYAMQTVADGSVAIIEEVTRREVERIGPYSRPAEGGD